MNDVMHAVAVRVFQRLYRNKRIIFSVDYDARDYENPMEDNDVYNYLTIYDKEIAEKFMRKFGGAISKVDMTYFPFKEDSYELFSHLVSIYCTESLVELDFKGQFHLDRLPTPFKNVQSIFFRGTFPYCRMANVNERMNKTFPALRRLSMDIPYFDQEYMNCYFPDLEYLFLSDTTDDTEDNNLIGLLDSNPQIEIVEVERTTQKFLETLNEKLPNIKNLTVTEKCSRIFTNRFDNVITLKIMHSVFLENHMTFPKLQELNIDLTIEDIERARLNFDHFSDFFRRHSTVNRFVLSYQEGSDLLLDRMASHLQNIVEMEIYPSKSIENGVSRITAYAISNFILRHNKLMQLNLSLCTEFDKEIFHKSQLHKTWNIIDYEQCLTFTRKPIRL